MRYLLTIIAAILMIAFSTASAPCAIIMVDEFSDPEYLEVLPGYGNTGTWTGAALSQVIGGTRRIEYARFNKYTEIYTPGWGEGMLAGEAFLMASGMGQSVAAVDNGASGYGNLYLTYDAGGAGLNADFSGSENIVLNFLADYVGGFDGGSTIMAFTLIDKDGSSYTSAKEWLVWHRVDAWVNEYFPLSDFTSNGVDLSDVNSIQFFFQASTGSDTVFERFYLDGNGTTTVPEPSTAALVLLSLGGAAAFRRKNRHS